VAADTEQRKMFGEKEGNASQVTTSSIVEHGIIQHLSPKVDTCNSDWALGHKKHAWKDVLINQDGLNSWADWM
jgi:hypothetical protein